MPRTKVIFVVNDLLIGGAQRIILDICSLIDRTMFEPRLVVLKRIDNRDRQTFVDRFNELGVEIFYLDATTRMQKVFELYKILKHDKTAILHAFLPDSVIMSVLVGKLLKIRVIVHEMNSLGFFNAKLKFAFILARRFSRLNIFYSSNLELESYKTSNSINYIPKTLNFSHCSIIDPVNLTEIDKFIGNKSRDELRRKLEVQVDEIMVLSVARLIDWKGHQYLIKAFERLVEHEIKAKLFIAGDGSYKTELSKLLDTLPEKISEKIYMLGSRTDVYSLMNSCDIFSLAIKYPDGFESISLGMSSMEALGVGKATIASRYEDLYSGLIDNQHLLLVEPGSVSDLYEKLLLLSQSKELRDKIGQNARKYVEDNFSAAKVIKIYEKIYSLIRDEK